MIRKEHGGVKHVVAKDGPTTDKINSTFDVRQVEADGRLVPLENFFSRIPGCKLRLPRFILKDEYRISSIGEESKAWLQRSEIDERIALKDNGSTGPRNVVKAFPKATGCFSRVVLALGVDVIGPMWAFLNPSNARMEELARTDRVQYVIRDGHASKLYLSFHEDRRSGADYRIVLTEATSDHMKKKLWFRMRTRKDSYIGQWVYTFLDIQPGMIVIFDKIISGKNRVGLADGTEFEIQHAVEACKFDAVHGTFVPL